MNRYQFLVRLFAGFLMNAWFSRKSFATRKLPDDEQVLLPQPGQYLLSATVAGQMYYDFPKVGAGLLGMDEDIYTSLDGEFTEHEAKLVLEPDNPHDHRAIAVYWQGYKMGYVPRKDNKILYNLLHNGANLDAKLRLQVTFEVEEDILYSYDFYQVFEMRLRVYMSMVA